MIKPVINFNLLRNILHEKDISQFYYISSHESVTIAEPSNENEESFGYGFYENKYTISYYDGNDTQIIGYIILYDTSSWFDYCAIKGVFTTCNYVNLTINEQPIYYLDHLDKINTYIAQTLGARIDENILDNTNHHNVSHLINNQQLDMLL